MTFTHTYSMNSQLCGRHRMCVDTAQLICEEIAFCFALTITLSQCNLSDCWKGPHFCGNQFFNNSLLFSVVLMQCDYFIATIFTNIIIHNSYATNCLNLNLYFHLKQKKNNRWNLKYRRIANKYKIKSVNRNT